MSKNLDVMLAIGNLTEVAQASISEFPEDVLSECKGFEFEAETKDGQWKLKLTAERLPA